MEDLPHNGDRSRGGPGGGGGLELRWGGLGGEGRGG